MRWQTLLLCVFLAGSAEVYARCIDYQTQRQVLFGDLHVHTRYSLDASTQNTRTTPAEAYRFARGETLGIQPWTADGEPMRSLKLETPLDFAAVTDHAELLGEVHICQNPSEPGYETWQCRLYRNYPRAAFFLFNTQSSRVKRLGFCGDDGQYCRRAAAAPWRDIQQAAEVANDAAGCSFSSFVAYEWTGASDNLANLHRNIIFRNADVPALPISFIDAPSAEQLWNALDEQCVAREGQCDVLVIPHNSNLSDGFMFQTQRENGAVLDAKTALQRQRLERLVEIVQHKGSSECYYGVLGGEDELCAFEQLPYARFQDKFLGKILPAASRAPAPSAGYVRDVLGQGLMIENTLGVNPFQFGVIGSTDTHTGAAGAVSEAGFLGHGGAGAVVGEGLPKGLVDDIEYNPGGLAAVWAEENSREAIFAALRRRETYATSGPRITLRFFAGSEFPEDMCQRENYAELGYAMGVPMGGELTAASLGDGHVPVFSVFAAADSREGQQALQRIQIIKGSVDAKGRRHEQVIDVAGKVDANSAVNLQTCETTETGFKQLCTSWADPDYNAAKNHYYYARVLETPSCRWSQHICASAGVDCSQPQSITEGLEGCCSAEHRPTIQERAWSSPIWIKASIGESNGT